MLKQLLSRLLLAIESRFYWFLPLIGFRLQILCIEIGQFIKSRSRHGRCRSFEDECCSYRLKAPAKRDACVTTRSIQGCSQCGKRSRQRKSIWIRKALLSAAEIDKSVDAANLELAIRDCKGHGFDWLIYAPKQSENYTYFKNVKFLNLACGKI